jgi:hypothetical protein
MLIKTGKNENADFRRQNWGKGRNKGGSNAEMEHGNNRWEAFGGQEEQGGRVTAVAKHRSKSAGCIMDRISLSYLPPGLIVRAWD